MTVSVLDYGADPTGQADSRPAFTAALSALSAMGGGTLIVPAGLYAWSSWQFRFEHVRLPPGCSIVGEGRDLSRIRVTAYDNPAQRALVVRGDTSSGPHADVRIEGIEIDYRRTYDETSKQAAAVWCYAGVYGLTVEGCRLLAGSGDGLYLGMDVQGVQILDLEGDAARSIVTMGGNSAGRWRVGYWISGLRRVDTGAVPAGKRWSSINVERGKSSEDTFWGVLIEDVDAAGGAISVAACQGARLRRIKASQLWYHHATVTLEDADMVSEAGAGGDGLGYLLCANAPGEIRVIGGRLEVAADGAGVVYQRTTIPGPMSAIGYGVEVVRPAGKHLHHPALWRGSRWYALTEESP